MIKKSVFIFLLGSILFADNFQDGINAYKRGDYKKALKYYESSCKEKGGKGCYESGMIYNSGLVNKIDNKKASKYFEKACENKDARGCFALGRFHEGKDGFKANFKQSLEFYKKGCDYKNQASCDSYKRVEKILKDKKHYKK